jgi:hypothetical protein
LLNNDYKVLARVLTRRLHPLLADQLSTTQYCRVSDNTILDALAGIRDILAHCEDKGKPISLLTLDFKQAFDRISHHYLDTMLRQYGITNWFADRLQEVYTQAQASVQVNGNLAGPIEIRSGVRQGCPISMILYSLCLHPLLRSLEKTLSGIPIGDQVCSLVIAYADDITVFVSNPEDFNTISSAIRQYEMASGAQLNPHKSKALAIGTWKSPAPLMGINFHERVEILGVSFGQAMMIIRTDSWTRVISAVRAQARQSYTRNLQLSQRIQYVKMHLFAKMWFLSQVLLLNRTHVHQLTAIATWFIWRGSIFKVPTLQLPKLEEGWDLTHVETKCKALLYNRLQVNGAKRGTVMAGLMRK